MWYSQIYVIPTGQRVYLLARSIESWICVPEDQGSNSSWGNISLCYICMMIINSIFVIRVTWKHQCLITLKQSTTLNILTCCVSYVIKKIQCFTARISRSLDYYISDQIQWQTQCYFYVALWTYFEIAWILPSCFSC